MQGRERVVCKLFSVVLLNYTVVVAAWLVTKITKMHLGGGGGGTQPPPPPDIIALLKSVPLSALSYFVYTYIVLNSEQ